jgi:hypothetical protein
MRTETVHGSKDLSSRFHRTRAMSANYGITFTITTPCESTFAV